MSDTNDRAGLLARLWAFMKTPKFGMLAIAFIGGILFWGAFNTAFEVTNREEFCIGCHEMKDNVYAEYRNTIHYQNRTGVRATCPDCHVPKEWGPKIIRKIQASNEVLHKLLGSIDTPEKFNAKRAVLAQHEWDRMKGNDSRECRNCHNYSYMDYAEQNVRSAAKHQVAFSEGQTCIDCHKGIAHTLPPIEQAIGAPKEGAAVMPPTTGTSAAGGVGASASPAAPPGGTSASGSTAAAASAAMPAASK